MLTEIYTRKFGKYRQVIAVRVEIYDDKPRYLKIIEELSRSLGSKESLARWDYLPGWGVCNVCYRPFACRNTRATPEFCSTDCRNKSRREHYPFNFRKRPSRKHAPHPVTCSACGETFQAKRIDARYCGATCRKRAQRRLMITA